MIGVSLKENKQYAHSALNLISLRLSEAKYRACIPHECCCPYRLVSPDILRLVHDGARMVYVGKQKGFHTRTQDEIHELLCHFAMEGSSVLRLKGGDPFVFGRGGEEVQYLQQRNIKTHVVPGMLHLMPACVTRLLQTSMLFHHGGLSLQHTSRLQLTCMLCTRPDTA